MNCYNMAKWVPCIQVLSIITGLLVIVLPGSLSAKEIALLADLEYFYTKENSTAKETGVVTDSEFSRFSQLYQLDINRFVYPNVIFNLGGYFERTDSTTKLNSSLDPELSADTDEKIIRPYMEVNLRNPLYKAGLAYRKRDTKTSGTFQPQETVTVDEYDAKLNWLPVELPLLNINFQRIELQDDPLTFDATRDTLTLTSKYYFKDFNFNYFYNRLDNFNNIEQSGNLLQTHNGSLRYSRWFGYKETRFDVNASAKYIYNTVKFTGSSADNAVDTPAASPGSPFFILPDPSPTSNVPADLTEVSPGTPLSNVNIGIDGGTNPVSAGLSFETPTAVDTIYIQLSSDQDSFPNLASPNQVASVADNYSWQFYSSNDQLGQGQLNWAPEGISSVEFNSIDNRFQLRLNSTVRARHIKVTTIPLHLIAPGEIRYDDLSPYITVFEGSGQEEPEDLSQYYTFGLQWTLSPKTLTGYEGYYRKQEAGHILFERKDWTNSLFFRHTFNPVFGLHGRVSRSDRNLTTEQDKENIIDILYSLTLRANYLATLSQTLTFSGSNTDEPEGSTTTNSLVFRTNADLYASWSMNLDFGYAFNTLLNGADQKVRSVRLGTIVEPNSKINISLDYTRTVTEETNQVDTRTEYGTFQALWVLTNTMNMFFRYNFRNQKGQNEISTSLREFNINWAPFPEGTLQFSIGYNETTDFAEREIKTISPTVTWRVARGMFLDLRYNTGTVDSPTESSELDSLIAKLRIFY